jgi:ubiquinone/menaquinone biosynthesis C-methylase UbiE
MSWGIADIKISAYSNAAINLGASAVDRLIEALRAAGEPTRLRVLALCAQGELTVSELTHILGQSQPRISRHLKLLCEAGLLERQREGSWAYFRLPERGFGSRLARMLVQVVPADDGTIALDLERLEAVKRDRSERAAAYFRENAARWDSIRALHVPEAEVEAALVAFLPERGIDRLLDIGTGTGRMLEVLAPHARSALGIDLSREMLTVARANLAKAGLRHCELRRADMYNLPFPGGSFDAVLFHMVLHYAEEPAAAILEAGRVLRPGGSLLVVDFGPHALDSLRLQHAHRWLGFDEDQMQGWLRRAGLHSAAAKRLPGHPLTVLIWKARRPEIWRAAEAGAFAAEALP